MSDEADRRRAYAELAGRGQPVPGKNFGKIKAGKRVTDPPPVKPIDMTKMKQLKLLKVGGLASADPFGDLSRKEAAALMRKMKSMGRPKRLRTKPSRLSVQGASIVTPKGMNIQKNMIMPKMMKKGGVVDMTKSIIINPVTGE
tara:strand:- start:1641 stop:2069 length:429 start_codon:yes stop_codon:yes gene_type:complete